MTYLEIVGMLRELQLDQTLYALRTAVRQEGEALLSVTPRPWTALKKRNAEESAEIYYAMEISEELAKPSTLTAEQILWTRRRPTAWAIADKIREEKARRLGGRS